MNKWLNKWFNDPFNLVWNVYLGCLNWLHWLHPSRMSSLNKKSSMYRVRIQTCITVDFPPHYSSIVFVPLRAKSALPSIWGPQRVTSRYSCSSLLFHINSNRCEELCHSTFPACQTPLRPSCISGALSEMDLRCDLLPIRVLKSPSSSCFKCLPV